MSDLDGPDIQHWLVGVARAADIPEADRLSIPSDSKAHIAWQVLGMTCGLEEEEIARVVAEHFGLERALPERRDLTAARLLPGRTARRYQVVPLGYSDRDIQVGSADPVSLDAEREVAHLTSRSVHFHIATPSELDELLEVTYPEHEEPTHRLPSLESEELSSPHVLVVDDDADTRLLLETALRAEGFRVTPAPDGPEALQILEGADAVHLVSLDLMMEKMHGMEVLRRIRADDRTAALPVIVATGRDDPDTEMEALKTGADDFIVKPIDPPRFVLRVQAVLRRYRAGAPDA